MKNKFNFRWEINCEINFEFRRFKGTRISFVEEFERIKVAKNLNSACHIYIILSYMKFMQCSDLTLSTVK